MRMSMKEEQKVKDKSFQHLSIAQSLNWLRFFK